MGPAYHKSRSFFILQSPIKKEEEEGSGRRKGQSLALKIGLTLLPNVDFGMSVDLRIHIEDFAICAALSGNLNQAQNEGSYVCLLGCIITIIITKN